MTNENGDNDEGGNPEGNESTEAEQKAMLKSIADGMKSMNEKMDAVTKENATLKDAVAKNAEDIAKITKALEQPIHKSPGVQPGDAEAKAKAGAEQKSVDPLSLF